MFLVYVFVRYSYERGDMFSDGYGCEKDALYMASSVQNERQ